MIRVEFSSLLWNKHAPIEAWKMKRNCPGPPPLLIILNWTLSLSLSQTLQNSFAGQLTLSWSCQFTAIRTPEYAPMTNPLSCDAPIASAEGVSLPPTPSSSSTARPRTWPPERHGRWISSPPLPPQHPLLLLLALPPRFCLLLDPPRCRWSLQPVSQ